MALVGQVATIAQFTGVDAYGLIKMIAEAAQTVRRNRKACLQLARRAQMIGDLLERLHSAQLMQQPETRNPVEQLEETLRRAYVLVRSCQGRSYLYRCFMGARHADELREVQSEIIFYLQLFPLVSYVDATLNWVKLLTGADPSCEEAPMVRPYFVCLVFVSWDGSCLAVSANMLQSFSLLENHCGAEIQAQQQQQQQGSSSVLLCVVTCEAPDAVELLQVQRYQDQSVPVSSYVEVPAIAVEVPTQYSVAPTPVEVEDAPPRKLVALPEEAAPRVVVNSVDAVEVNVADPASMSLARAYTAAVPPPPHRAQPSTHHRPPTSPSAPPARTMSSSLRQVARSTTPAVRSGAPLARRPPPTTGPPRPTHTRPSRHRPAWPLDVHPPSPFPPTSFHMSDGR
ncbi:hypothetical protein GUJ93_ZPchr0011g28639 [Zizania palustris]|uniref:MCAfunc domain-containing protein n=1 Tax=Zizania palustris TaxID=103762 RepID=A0A8J5WG16_ZIZPA|nr:hypothetical protein GUJ93_ZPchr0011g28639 [Zizania palustris]